MMTSTTIITLFLHLLILGIHVDASEYFIFQPGRSDLDINNIEHEGNWKDVPCVNDRVVFDPEKIVVTMLGQSLDVNMISLPNDGIIFFDNHATLGEKGEFQCRRKAKSEDAFFTGGTGYYNFHDFGNWEPALDNGRPRLHSQMVPGSQDMVIFDDGHPSMVQIDHHVKVGELYFGDRFHTTHSFSKRLLWTVEGQLQFRLGRNLARYTAIDGIEFRWPLIENSSVLIGVGFWPNASYGAVSSNIREPFLSSICEFVKCEKTEAYCSNPIKPRGHCCYVCARRTEFEMTGVPMNTVETVIDRIYENEDSENVGITVIKITEDAIMPFYQLAIISNHPSEFDTDKFEHLEWKFMDTIRYFTNKYHGLTLSHLKSEYSTQHNKLRAGSFFAAFIVFATLITLAVLGTYGVREYETNPSFRLWLTSYRNRTQEFASIFTKARGDDGDDEVTLVHSDVNPNFVDESMEFVNRGYDLAQMDPVDHGSPGDDKKKDDDKNTGEKLVDIDL